MGLMQRRKGYRVEHEITKYLQESGIDAKRVPLSGSADGFKGDIVINWKNKTLKCEVKARKDGFNVIYNNLPSTKDASLKLTTGKNRLLIVRIDTFIEFLKTGKLYKYQNERLNRKHKQIDQWIEDVDVLFLKANRKPVLAVMRINDILKLRGLISEGVNGL